MGFGSGDGGLDGGWRGNFGDGWKEGQLNRAGM
jgi:hypothetical protein